MKRLLQSILVIFCWVPFGFCASKDFSVEDIRQLNLRPAGQLVADADYVPQPSTAQSQYYLDYIKAAITRTWNSYPGILFKISPTFFTLDLGGSGYYVAPSMLAIAQAIYAASSSQQSPYRTGLGLATSPLLLASIPAPSPPAASSPPQSVVTVFSAATLSSWATLEPSQFRGFLANESGSQQAQPTTEEQDFLTFFNTKIKAVQSLTVNGTHQSLESVTTPPHNIYQIGFRRWSNQGNSWTTFEASITGFPYLQVGGTYSGYMYDTNQYIWAL